MNLSYLCPTGRLTWRALAQVIDVMDEFQKDTDVTILASEDECFAGELIIGHDSLDDNHPVIKYLKDEDDGPSDDCLKEKN